MANGRNRRTVRTKGILGIISGSVANLVIDRNGNIRIKSKAKKK